DAGTEDIPETENLAAEDIVEQTDSVDDSGVIVAEGEERTEQALNEPTSNPADSTDSETASTDNTTGTETTNNTQPATGSTTNTETSADPIAGNTTSDTTTTATSSQTSSDSTSNTADAVVSIPSQPIMSINSEFADHWIDTRPQTAIIIELKQDADDDERFFYLYSDITRQAGYSIDTGNGTVSYNGDDTVTYTARAGFSGTDTFFYAYDGWDYGRGGYGRGSSFNSYGYDWQDYSHWGYGQGWGYGISDAEIDRKSRYYSKRKRKAKVRVSKHLGSPIGPTICQIYAVHDEGASDSQFVKFEVIDLKGNRTVSQKIGQEYKGFDIEAIAIHPITAMLYAASQNLLYLVHPSEASLKVIGEIGYDEITGFAFHPKEATLFAATDTDDKDKQKGILQIDPDTGASKMILPSSYGLEALAWNVEGTILYAAEKTKHPNKNGVMIKGSNLIAWYYDGTRLLGQGYEDTAVNAPTTRSTRSDTETESVPAVTEAIVENQILPDSEVDFLRLGLNVIGSTETGRDIEINAETGAGGDSPFKICEGFGEIDGEVESLETRADGLLLFSVDQGRGNKIYAFNPKTCQVEEETSFGTPYSDIEAIAWPIHCQSSTVPVPKGWDIDFIGSNGSFCIEEGKPFEIKGKAKFSSKGFLNLKTTWEVVAPENAKCPEIAEESGLANLNRLIDCPAEALKNSQMLTGSSDFSITAWWPGLTDARGNYYNTIEVQFTAELFDMLGKPMQDYADNNLSNGSSIASRSVIATAEICKPPEPLSPSQLLSEFFVNDYAIDSDAFNLSSDSLSVVIEGQTYSGEMTQAMLAAIEQGVPSSSFQDENMDGIDDLVLVYADGTQQILFADAASLEETNDSAESEQSKASDEEQDNTSDTTDVVETVAEPESNDAEVIETEATEEDSVDVSETDELDFSEYAAKFNNYLQQVLAQSEYDFNADGLLSLVLNNIEYSGRLSEQPVDKVEPFEGNILFGELTQDEQHLPYFPITFQDGQVFALYYLGESDNDTEQSDPALDED
ncbi:MAG: Ig-like domain-containing protein, partial [Thiotrichaceae bacterium]|nr:Ig-like domain-containing protein [Thiotrichaceae bacterium]